MVFVFFGVGYDFFCIVDVLVEDDFYCVFGVYYGDLGGWSGVVYVVIDMF